MPIQIKRLLRNLDLCYPPGVQYGHVVLINAAGVTNQSFEPSDINTTANTISIPGLDWPVGFRVQYSGPSLNPLASATNYWILSNTAGVIQLTETEGGIGGSAIDLTEQGSSTHNLVASPIDEFSSIIDIVYREVAEPYTRPAYTPGTGIIDTVNNWAKKPSTDTVDIANNGTNPIVFDHYVLLKDSAAIQGDYTGEDWEAFLVTNTETGGVISIGTTKVFQLNIINQNVIG